MFPDL